ncbi:M23 family metallopeptidase [Trichlorobacter sp.]|uniref:M23 family metallopeptidase n=1 Tax=Trichlorobacter sp. TaxID=2911007 RepID=UPI002A371261|nr:M23 family metallopeptidase [Trichlorobacter sp.]MDY0384579.1 M23 family metallopeptidase [Trichlorobacter sp.]
MVRLRLYTAKHISILVLILFLLATPVQAAPPVLELPIRCTLEQDCFIQNYFDTDPGPGAHDYTCGKLTYDTHHGTDFRLRDLSAMRSKVAVIAAAPGVVVGVRDGEPDVYLKQRDKASLKGKEAGNGVRIDHGDGWATQYSHLLLGSVVVRKGQRINAGDVLGMVGLSGNTEFPHLDMSVSKDGKPLDPFNPEAKPCGKSDRTLWSATAMKALRYQPTGVLITGFAATSPQKEVAEAGGYDVKTIPDDAENLVFWVELFGLHKGDRLTLELYGPDKQRISNSQSVLPGDKAVWFAYNGKRRRAEFWPKGNYSGLIRLERVGRVVVEEQKQIEVNR